MLSSIFSSMPQKRLKGSEVSGDAPRWRYDSSTASEDEEDDWRGEKEGSVGLKGPACGFWSARAAAGEVFWGGRRANGGTPRVGESGEATRPYLAVQLLMISCVEGGQDDSQSPIVCHPALRPAPAIPKLIPSLPLPETPSDIIRLFTGVIRGNSPPPTSWTGTSRDETAAILLFRSLANFRCCVTSNCRVRLVPSSEFGTVPMEVSNNCAASWKAERA